MRLIGSHWSGGRTWLTRFRRALVWAALLCGVVLWAAPVTLVAVAPPSQGSGTIHVVQAGETLFRIAQRYGTTVAEIASVNELSDPDQVAAGQRLLIPSAGSESSPGAKLTEYSVQPGDTLAFIARRFDTTTEDLARLNHLANPHMIYVGQRLLLSTSEADPPGTEAPGPFPARSSQVYVVQPGDTMARVAARYGMSVWALAQANQLVNPNVIHTGQRLLIPTDEGSSSLPLPFIELEIVPAIAVQGRTVQVSVKTDGEVSLSGDFDGYPLVFVGDAGQYRALIGVPAMAAPGPYPLDLRATIGQLGASLHSMLYVAEGDFGLQYITLSAEKAGLLDPDLVAQEAQRIREVTAQVSLPGLWQGPFRVPLAETPGLSAPFGVRRSYNGGPATSYHAGVDYSAGGGEPVYCPARGRIVLAEPLLVRGNAVIVDHGRGVMSGYWHLSQINVTAGQAVEQGEVLGLVGSTGLSTGAHLHWEIQVMGVPVDPLQWVREHVQ
jgi:murein DD-endopeptidase MepM/ murein hydrolase activator NlpD